MNVGEVLGMEGAEVKKALSSKLRDRLQLKKNFFVITI